MPVIGFANFFRSNKIVWFRMLVKVVYSIVKIANVFAGFLHQQVATYWALLVSACLILL